MGVIAFKTCTRLRWFDKNHIALTQSSMVAWALPHLGDGQRYSQGRVKLNNVVIKGDGTPGITPQHRRRYLGISPTCAARGDRQLRQRILAAASTRYSIRFSRKMARYLA